MKTEIELLQEEVLRWQNAYNEAREAYKAAKEDANAKAQILRETNTLRTAMLNMTAGVPDVNRIWFAAQKATWAQMDIDVTLAWLDVFQAGQEVFAELIAAKKGKLALKKHVEDVNNAKRDAVNAYREKCANGEFKEEKKAPKEKLSPEEKGKAKAISALMKMGITQEAAEEVFKTMTGGGK